MQYRIEFRHFAPEDYNTSMSRIPLQLTMQTIEDGETAESVLRRELELTDDDMLRVYSVEAVKGSEGLDE